MSEFVKNYKKKKTFLKGNDTKSLCETKIVKQASILRKKLIPYESKIRNLSLIKLRQEIISNINPDEFNKLRKLDGRALCGYDAQIAEYYKNIKENKEESEVLDNEWFER